MALSLLLLMFTSGLDFMALHIAQRISTSRGVRLEVLVASPVMVASDWWCLGMEC